MIPATNNALFHRINTILSKLKCKEIIEFLSQLNINKVNLLTLVIESKMGYDQLITDIECRSFINEVEENTIYSSPEYSELIMVISKLDNEGSTSENAIATLNKFQAFHKTVNKTGTLLINLLSEGSSASIINVSSNLTENPLFGDLPPNPIEQHSSVSQMESLVHHRDRKVFSINTFVGKSMSNSGACTIEEGNLPLDQFFESIATG